MNMREIISRGGGVKRLSDTIGRHHATLLGWTRVPPQHVRAVSAATGIPPHELRPDLWDPPATSGVAQQQPVKTAKAKRSSKSRNSETPSSQGQAA